MRVVLLFPALSASGLGRTALLIGAGMVYRDLVGKMCGCRQVGLRAWVKWHPAAVVLRIQAPVQSVWAYVGRCGG